MKIAITGASGFIGRHVLPVLLAGGHDIVALSSQDGRPPSPGMQWLTTDLLNDDACRRAMDIARPDCLLHLAWYAVHGRFWNAPENFAWSRATANLLEGFRNVGGRRVVIAGTCAEYDWSHGYCIEEVTPTVPASLYGKCKDATRQFAQDFCRQNDIHLAWGRIFSPYGPGEPEGRLLPSILKAMIRCEPVRCSHGRQYRDFLHVRDVASAFAHLAVGTDATGVFNVSSGQPLRISEIVSLCSSLFENVPAIEFGAVPVADSDPMLLVGCSEKLERTGWAPRVPIAEGLSAYRDSYVDLMGVVDGSGKTVRA